MVAKQTSYKLFLLILLSISMFTSCITSKKINYLQETSHKIPKYDHTLSFEEYKLTTGDRISVRIFSTDKKMNMLFNGSSEGMSMMASIGSDNADLYTYLVKDDGTISLPSADSIDVMGKTLREAKHNIEKALLPYFKDQFSVDLKIVERYFSIIGSNNNGKFPISKEKTTIFQALAMAGDISTFGDRSKIKIIRQINGNTQVKTFDIRSKDVINSEFYYIQDNDIIYIQDVKEQFFSVTSVGAAFSTIFSSISFGLFIYNLVKVDAQ